MAYYIRVLSTSPRGISVSELQSAIDAHRFPATLAVEAGTRERWEALLLRHRDGREIAVIEHNAVEIGSLGSGELEEFAEEISDCKPESSVQWLLHYFPRVRSIYAFQLLTGADDQNGCEILEAVKNRIFSFAPSILQADAEGFTNEEGYHILWQFNDSAQGSWRMGVLRNGEWVHFQMDLGNIKHRESFCARKVPDGVKLA